MVVNVAYTPLNVYQIKIPSVFTINSCPIYVTPYQVIVGSVFFWFLASFCHGLTFSAGIRTFQICSLINNLQCTVGCVRVSAVGWKREAWELHSLSSSVLCCIAKANTGAIE